MDLAIPRISEHHRNSHPVWNRLPDTVGFAAGVLAQRMETGARQEAGYGLSADPLHLHNCGAVGQY